MYPLFFGVATATALYGAFATIFPWSALLGWCSLSCLIMLVAYSANTPWLVCGKKANGRVNAALLFLNLPWLLFTWTTWGLITLFSKEDACNRIGDTNFYISRFPLWGVDLSAFDLVIDLTCEFPRMHGQAKTYICRPNLDGIALANCDILCSELKEEKYLVHCAQGHGRSAIFMSHLAAATVGSPRQAYELILKSRPGARASKAQLRQILK